MLQSTSRKYSTY